ncbi:hypothetical protein [Psychromonas sp. GE-S-Ul-11]|uniref:hypothetical protein n=1 Tax=Psychromonas sp. GE-S-Ul-11 TaxID=3241170 RepID=UPI00390C83B1
MDWVNVADTAVKIGLGALISAISGFCVLKKTQEHEFEKEQWTNFLKRQEVQKAKYVEFTSSSHKLTYDHVNFCSGFETDDYKTFLMLYNEVAIISPKNVQAAAHQLFDCTNQYIGFNKNSNSEQRDELILTLRNNANKALIAFQCSANVEVTSEYKKI